MEIIEYIFFITISLGLTFAGWKITFTKSGLEWMYKNNIWKKKDAIFDKTSGMIFDRISGSGLFFLGLILTGFILYRILIDFIGI